MERNLLWEKYYRDKTLKNRNNLLLEFCPLVNRVVKMMPQTYMGYFEQDDLISYGIFGLLDAIEKYNPAKNVKFETYASIRIRGAVIDHIRKYDILSRNTRKKLKIIEEKTELIENSEGRTPSYEELSEETGFSVKEIIKVIEESALTNMMSLEEIIFASNSMPNKSSGIMQPEAEYQKAEIKEALSKAIDNLDETDQYIITLYYYEELTLKEIGEVLNLSESRISQKLSKILFRLKSKMKNFI